MFQNFSSNSILDLLDEGSTCAHQLLSLTLLFNIILPNYKAVFAENFYIPYIHILNAGATAHDILAKSANPATARAPKLGIEE